MSVVETRWARLRHVGPSLLLIVVLTPWISASAFSGQSAEELIEHAEQILRDTPSYPDAIERVIPLYRVAIERFPEHALPYRRLAWACLEFGELADDDEIEWYRCGRDAAERALELDEANAEAHFLFAATKGLVAEQLPFWRISPKTPFDLERHLLRGLDLDPAHARSLNMMGMLLNEVPGPLRALMQGSKEEAEGYLIRAVEAAPNSTRLRKLLAEYYEEEGKPQMAEEQAKIIVHTTEPMEPWLWQNKHKPDAKALLRKLGTQ